MSDLNLLRAQMQEVDRQLLQLAARRMQLAASIGDEKRASGMPLRDYDVERLVLERGTALAAEVGLSADLARGLFSLLIQESRLEQERKTYATYTGDAERIVVIGGRGKMGRWLVEFFSNQGHTVDIWDTAEPQSSDRLAERLAGASFAAIATPLHTVPETIREVAHGGFGGVIFDIASLKGHLAGEIANARRAGAAITSIHPMFGPAARTLSDKVICICDCGDAEATRRVARLFSETAATLAPLSFEEHDRIVAYVLGLSHLANLWLARVLRRSGISFERLNRVGSTTFHSQMATTMTVVRDNPELYYEIQRLNPFTPAMYSAALDELAAIEREVQQGDAAAFVAAMSDGRAWMEAR
ncbi:MAG: prephenate dehydrogenase/arogenate dehydrogenase family protein [Planctomycetes bacterium]|nr:prephenate dehydrogenase/arogenate dehydrogenase family protein [Planctomycetota bacterium]